MDDIESYEPQRSEILESEPGWATAFFEGELPRSAEAVAVGDEDEERFYGIARERLGGRRVRLMFLDDREIDPGQPVERTERSAGLLAGDTGIDLTNRGIRPEGAGDRWFPLSLDPPAFSELRGRFPALEIGFEAIDVVAPFAAGGTNLVIDTSDSRAAFRHLADRLVEADPPERTIGVRLSDAPRPDWLDHPIVSTGSAHGHMAAVRTAAAYGARLRATASKIVVVIELPATGRTAASDERMATTPGYGDVVDLVASGLASTAESRVTTLLRLPVTEKQPGLSSIVETLDVGDVENQVFIDASGRFVPDRSTSDADRPAEGERRRDRAMEMLDRAERAREKRELLGERELTDAEERALRRAAELRTEIAP